MTTYRPATLFEVLGSNPRDNMEPFDRYLKDLHLKAYREPLLVDPVFRSAFREQLRLAQLMESVLRRRRYVVTSKNGRKTISITSIREIPVLGVDLLVEEQRVDFIRPIMTTHNLDGVTQDLPYLFYDQGTSYSGFDNCLTREELLPLKIELLRNPAFREAFAKRFYRGLTAKAKELRSTLAGLRRNFHQMIENPFKMQFSTLFSSKARLKAGFEFLGQVPLLEAGEHYDLPSLVEHYCALFGHNEHQKLFLQQHNKWVYLSQLEPPRKYIFPTQFSMEEILAEGSGPTMTHYLEQFWLQGQQEAARVVLNGLVTGPETTFNQFRMVSSLTYDYPFLEWLLANGGSSQGLVAALIFDVDWRHFIDQSRVNTIRRLISVAKAHGTSSFWESIDDACRCNDEQIFVMLLRATDDAQVKKRMKKKRTSWRKKLPPRFMAHIRRRLASVG